MPKCISLYNYTPWDSLSLLNFFCCLSLIVEYSQTLYHQIFFCCVFPPPSRTLIRCMLDLLILSHSSIGHTFLLYSLSFSLGFSWDCFTGPTSGSLILSCAVSSLLISLLKWFFISYYSIFIFSFCLYSYIDFRVTLFDSFCLSAASLHLFLRAVHPFH